MQDRPVADDNAFLNVEWAVKVGMNDTTVLKVNTRTEGDARQVAAEDGAIPEVDPRGKDDVPRDHRPRRDVVIMDSVHAVSSLAGSPQEDEPGWTQSVLPSAQFSFFQIGTSSLRRSMA